MGQTRDPGAAVTSEANVDRELLDLLYRNAPLTLFSSTAVAALLLSALYHSEVGQKPIVSWVAILVLSNLARLILRSFRESSLVSDRYRKLWLQLYTLMTFIAGLLWSSLVFIYQQSFTLYEQVIVLVTLLGIPMAALPNNALKLPVYYAFCIPVFISLQYWSYFVSAENHLEFSILAIAYSAIVVITGHVYHDSFKQVLRIGTP